MQSQTVRVQMAMPDVMLMAEVILTACLFASIGNRALTIKGFHPDRALPTYGMTRYPYLPGSKPQFFQGFSVLWER